MPSTVCVFSSLIHPPPLLCIAFLGTWWMDGWKVEVMEGIGSLKFGVPKNISSIKSKESDARAYKSEHGCVAWERLGTFYRVFLSLFHSSTTTICIAFLVTWWMDEKVGDTEGIGSPKFGVQKTESSIGFKESDARAYKSEDGCVAWECLATFHRVCFFPPSLIHPPPLLCIAFLARGWMDEKERWRRESGAG